ncbi:MAG: mechanosensitive ion channel family protein [Geminicoccaceae bacterium]
MARWSSGLLSILLLTALLVGRPALAQAPAEPTPDQVKSLLQLLSDPVVKGWIERESKGEAAAPPSAGSELTQEEASVSAFVEGRLVAAHDHLARTIAAAPGVPGELAATAGRLRQEADNWFPGEMALLIVVFVGLGLLAEWLFRRASAGVRARYHIHIAGATGPARLKAMGRRLLTEIVGILCFALGSIGAFMLFSWPPQFRRMFASYLVAAAVVRLVLSLCRLLFAPDRAELRVVPVADWSARFLTRWTTVFVAWFAFGLITIELLRNLGMDPPTAQLLSYGLGLGLLAIALRFVWRPDDEAPRHAGRLAWTVLVVAIWLLWVLGAKPAMWTLIVVGALPASVHGVHGAVRNLFRPAGDTAPLAAEGLPASAILLDRGLRFVLYALAIALLVWGWGLDVGALAAQESPGTRLAQGFLYAVVILLVADLLWKLARTAIDRQLALSSATAEPDTAHFLSPEEARRRARLRTLLPILRIVLFVVLGVTAILMALSSLGLQIAPLIAGAGVVGVAVGFGSQTLVKDIISGMFYLLDDAFRVGEYIVSGNYRGTVEGFSLRSIKLRHHRGPVYTVPFGMLGAVQNLSRDWVIDKITVGVTYDTDLDLVKKVIKQVSKEIMADPTLAQGILEPLKSQGVAAMGDFAIQVRMKFMARPGEQFVVRRAIYDKIKKAFDANGIRFAFPTVTVAGGDQDHVPAAARQAIAMVEKPAAE